MFGPRVTSVAALSSLVRTWQQALSEAKATDTRIALLCPVAVSEWIRHQERGDDLWVESHYEREYLLPDPLADWLLATLRPVELELENGQLLRLADLLLSDAETYRPVADTELAWWPDLLDVWLQSLNGDLPAPCELVRPAKDVPAHEKIDWLREHWTTVLDRMRSVSDALEPRSS
jgi:hypothetical protein